MTLDTQEHVQDTVRFDVPAKPAADAPVTHTFHTMERLGGKTDWKHRAFSLTIALLICSVLYGLLYLAMHLQD